MVSINGCETCASLQISVASRSSPQRVVRSWCSLASYFTNSEGGLTPPLPSSFEDVLSSSDVLSRDRNMLNAVGISSLYCFVIK